MPEKPTIASKPLLLILPAILLGYFSLNIASTIYHSLQSNQRLQQLQQEVVKLRQKHDQLQDTLKYQQTSQFVEQQARDSLSMARPNETVVIFPRQDQAVLGSATSSHSSSSSSHPPANFQAWIELFTK